MAKELIKPDFCVIGAGSGGLAFAAGALQMGASVVIVEKDKMGGDCLNYGCVPSKSLLAAAHIGDTLRRAKLFGWKINQHIMDYKKVCDHVDSVINSIAPHDSKERFEKLGAKVILDFAKFVDKHSIETEQYIIKAKRFIIATGSRPAIPPIPGLDTIKYYTNESIFGLKTLPRNLVVIGGGPIGTEMAQAFNNLGSKVSILEAFKFMPKDDPDLVTKLKNILNGQNITINENVKILGVTEKESEIIIKYLDFNENEKSINASHLFIATGRKPNIDNMGLDKAEVKFSKKGIDVNQFLQSSNRRVYAIGDSAGGMQFTHVAGYHAGLAIKNSIFKIDSKVKTEAIPWVTYTDPELAHVGFQEKQLKNSKIRHKIVTLDFSENDRAQAEKHTEGTIKLLATTSGHILGVTILGKDAGELIYPWVIAIQNNLKLSAIANSIAPYPTLNEINKRVAGKFYADKIFSSKMKTIVKTLMLLSH